MCKMIYRTVSTWTPSCLTHNNQRATVPFTARTHITQGIDTTVHILSLRSLISRTFLLYTRSILLTILNNPVLWTGIYLSRYSDSLWAGRFRDRIPAGGVGFPHQFLTRPWAHPSSYTLGAESLPGVKRPRGCIDHPSQSRSEVKERVELYIYSPFGHSWLVPGELYLYITFTFTEIY
jgi:hypothetical protein